MQERYTHAILELIYAGKSPDVLLSGLARTLEHKGHNRLHRAILNSVLRVLTAKVSQTVPVVTLANPADIHTYKDAIESALRTLQADNSEPVVTLDPTLSGGLIVEHKYQMVDMSFKSKLLKLYKTVTK